MFQSIKTWIRGAGILCALGISGMGFPPGSCHALEYQGFVEVFEGLFYENKYLDQGTGTFDYDETYLVTGLYPEVHVDSSNGISAHASGELEWIHSWDAEDENDLTFEMANIYLAYSISNGFVQAGLQSFSGGRSMIYDTDEPGVSLGWDIQNNLYLRGEAFRIFDHSPMAKLTLGYEPGFLETLEIFGAWYHDADDRIADLYASFDPESHISGSSAHLFWIGGQADVFIGDFYVCFLGAHEFGSVETTDSYGQNRPDMDVAAYLIDFEVNYNFSTNFSAAGFVFSASGDDRPETGNLNAFISPMPFNRRTAIFFNGGYERYDIEEAVMPGGVTWEGVVSPGIRMEYQLHPKVLSELTAAVMYPEGDLFDQDEWYGWETDIRLSWRFYQNHWLFLEAGRFTHGEFFKEKQGFRPDPATRMAAGARFLF